jgi:hypothetical protein
MGFDPCNYFLGLQLPKWELTWECEGSFPHTFFTPGSMRCDFWASLLAHTLASPCLSRKPNARVMTSTLFNH